MIAIMSFVRDMPCFSLALIAERTLRLTRAHLCGEGSKIGCDECTTCSTIAPLRTTVNSIRLNGEDAAATFLTQLA
jgi:hypothetical protein